MPRIPPDRPLLSALLHDTATAAPITPGGPKAPSRTAQSPRRRLPCAPMPPRHPSGSLGTRPRGRPTKLDEPIGDELDENGDPVTVTRADRIIALLRAGSYRVEAASAAGVHRDTLHEWTRRGADVMAQLLAGTPRSQFTRHELRLAAFSDACARAEAQALADDEILAKRLQRGGLERTTTTTVVGVCPRCDGRGVDGTERCPMCAGAGRTTLTQTTRVETSAPDGAMLRWRLAHRYPHLYSTRQGDDEVDELDELLDSTEAAALFGSLADVAEAYAAGHADGVTDASIPTPEGAS